ncbi:hypothetical protein [Komagataeibacter europaeus]|uniref:hypothetical protein n=1 Tax=Komagataeibacter europaeus TaxID=33995 RepID=UPI0002E07237|nr:hypothetical protein [Komagataeibacter europaeus]
MSSALQAGHVSAQSTLQKSDRSNPTDHEDVLDEAFFKKFQKNTAFLKKGGIQKLLLFFCL